jgi:ABC-2 type transport system permease protein
MAVHKRTYRAYEGAVTPRWSRFLVLTRYSARNVFRSRSTTGLFIISFLYPLLVIAGMYLNHNARVLSSLKVNSEGLFEVTGSFFLLFMRVQGALAFLLTAFIGPGLIAPDLANNALPLYLCRPLSRAEYVCGRACVILFLLSFVTWIPGLILYLIESSLSGPGWAWQHVNFAIGIVAGSWLWIGLLALLALALSAWVRWKLIAGALLLGVIFVSSGFALAINAVLRTKAGFYLDPANLAASVWSNILGVASITEISTFNALVALLAMSGICVALLARKVRAFEAVR